jgi:hypothetical protein
MGARMMSGQTKWHEQLERELAAFVGKEDAFLLNFGYQGMVSIIDCLLTPRDVAVYDAEAHACIIDGLRMHKGKRFVFGHNDMASLRKQLRHATAVAEESGGGILVITEGVFGMKGDLGRLDEIVAELQKIGTITVDKNMCIICVVGDLNWENTGFEARAMEAMKDIPVRMVSYGGSNYNISFLVREEDKVRALRSLSASIFEGK